jgi:hypothetical protein
VHAYVRFATAAICRQGATNSIAAHADFMRAIVQKSIQTQALELVRQHQNAGDMVAIVTATNEFVTRPIAEAFGVSELIAVELERESDGTGWYTGAIRGVPSFREGKVTRVAQWLQAHGLDWDSCAHHLLFRLDERPAFVGKGVRARRHQPGRPPAHLAQQRGWRILDLFSLKLMIKKFIDKLISKSSAPWVAKSPNLASGWTYPFKPTALIPIWWTNVL